MARGHTLVYKIYFLLAYDSGKMDNINSCFLFGSNQRDTKSLKKPMLKR